MRKNGSWIAGAALLFIVSTGFGQSRFQMGFSFEPFFPQGEFRDVTDRIGWGGSLDALYRIPESALHVGLSFAYHVYGHQNRWEPFNPTIPDVTVRVSTTNAMFRSHALVRLQTPAGRMRPYIEGLIGLEHLTTDTRVHDDSYWGDDGFAGSNQSRSTVFSYGVGGGVLLNLYRRPAEEKDRGVSLDLDIGMRYIRGGAASYLTPGDIEIRDGIVYYWLNRSRVDILSPKLGLTVAF
jgi:hypothetical protein